MVDKVSDAEEWRIQFETCNRILKAVGLEEYELTMVEEHPIEATVGILQDRRSWIDEDRAGLST